MTQEELKHLGFLPWPVGFHPYPNIYWDAAVEVWHPDWLGLRIIILEHLQYTGELTKIDFRPAWWREAPL